MLDSLFAAGQNFSNAMQALSRAGQDFSNAMQAIPNAGRSVANSMQTISSTLSGALVRNDDVSSEPQYTSEEVKPKKPREPTQNKKEVLTNEGLEMQARYTAKGAIAGGIVGALTGTAISGGLGYLAQGAAAAKSMDMVFGIAVPIGVLIGGFVANLMFKAEQGKGIEVQRK
ncbi:MAG: hypothetical protein JSS50_03065 [Proteobacteria bacterium]|nr:hypothetical protein [Pseudomonadota bacterium]